MEKRVNRKFHETLCNLLVARQILGWLVHSLGGDWLLLILVCTCDASLCVSFPVSRLPVVFRPLRLPEATSW